jgi:exodeoxyribonuclease V alpha subunit
MTLPLEAKESNDQPLVVEGVLERIVYANEENAWSVIRLSVPGRKEPISVVGNLVGIQPGETLRLTGKWVNDPKHGRQFQAASFATVAPTTLAGIEKYLGSGLIRGIGKVMAQRIVELFGQETLQVIEHHPERLAEVGGLGPKRRGEIQRAWTEQREVQEVMVFLQSHGVSTAHAARIYRAYGSSATELVRRNPYRLATDIRGIGFASADKIAAALGVAPDSPERLAAGLLHLLDEASDQGHLYLPLSRLRELAETLLDRTAPPVEAAVTELAQAGSVVCEPTGNDTAVYLRALHTAEAGIASRLSELLAQRILPIQLDLARALEWFERRENIALAPAQRDAIRAGIERPALVITGGPGTGKTTLVRGLVTILERKGQKVLLAAPTGRAAQRLQEATGHEASTLHRLLEWNARTHSFDRDRDHPLRCDLLLIDEASMLDAALAHQLLKAVPDGGRLIFVGDIDQLPSVGPGSVLGDLIRCDRFEVVRLNEVFRQAEKSLIVVNAHRIRAGQMPIAEAVTDPDFFLIERRQPEEILETIGQLVGQRIPRRFGLDPHQDIQVLSPMHRGPLGTERLNAMLRDLLNPSGRELVRGGNVLRIGDKVMQTRNNYDLEVWNGDIGKILEIDEVDQVVRVGFDTRTVAYDFGALDELTLAYACSIHKSQGSEYPCVIVPVHTQHYVMLQRNLLYTAITRARRLAILVGEPKALELAVGKGRLRPRYTRLAERLAD